MPEIKFKSDWLKGGDNVKHGDMIRFENAGIQDKDDRWVFNVTLLRNGKELYEKKFSLNKTNFKIVSKRYGTNSDEWVGKEFDVKLVDTQDHSGNPAIGIRLVPPGSLAEGRSEEEERLAEEAFEE